MEKRNKNVLKNTKIALGIATAMIGGYAGRVHAGTCTTATPHVCTGIADGAADVTQPTAQTVTGGVLSVTTTAGFGHDTTGKGGNAFTLDDAAANQITFTDNFNSSITGVIDGIHVVNAGNSYTTIKPGGPVTGGADGIDVYTSGTATDITITTDGTVTGNNAIKAATNSPNSNINITTAPGQDITANDGIGITATSQSRAITIISKGDIIAKGGSSAGIATNLRNTNAATAKTDIKTYGSITATSANGVGIFSTHLAGDAKDMEIETAKGAPINADVAGIFASTYGGVAAGASITITTNDTVSVAGNGIAIDVEMGNDGDISITSNEKVDGGKGTGINVSDIDGNIEITNKDIIASNDAIFVNTIYSTVNIASNGLVQSTSGTGIYVNTANDAGDVTITLGGNVEAAEDGIRIRHTTIPGTANTVTVTGTGDVTGGTSTTNDGIDIITNNDVIVDVDGTITGDPGITITSLNGPIDVTGTGAVNANPGDGIYTHITNPASDTDITIARDGAITATGAGNGITAINDGVGNIIITADNIVDGDTGLGISTQTAKGSNSTIILDPGAVVSGGIDNNFGESVTLVNTGASVSGPINLGDGSDSLSFSGGSFAGVTTFDGGDDIASGDGFVDELVFNGSSGFIPAANAINWERITVDVGSTIRFTSGGAATLTTGVLDNIGGTVSTEEGSVGDILHVTGDYGGGGTLVLEANLGVGTSDVLHVVGDTLGTTELDIVDLGGTGVATTGNGILVVQVDGTSAGIFTLGTPIFSGPFQYNLVKVGNNWYLQSTRATTLPATEIPTLSQWGQIALVSLLGLFGMFGFRRRR